MTDDFSWVAPTYTDLMRRIQGCEKERQQALAESYYLSLKFLSLYRPRYNVMTPREIEEFNMQKTYMSKSEIDKKKKELFKNHYRYFKDEENMTNENRSNYVYLLEMAKFLEERGDKANLKKVDFVINEHKKNENI